LTMVSVQFSDGIRRLEEEFPAVVCQHNPTGANSIFDSEAVEDMVVAVQLAAFSNSSSSSATLSGAEVGGPELPCDALTDAISLVFGLLLEEVVVPTRAAAF